MGVFYSSMYFDEDGDLAHEFYVEQRVQVKAGVVRWVMRKVSPSNLTPQVRTPSLSLSISSHSIFTAYLYPYFHFSPLQGEVDLPFPRLNSDLPIVLIDASFMLPFHMSDQVTT